MTRRLVVCVLALLVSSLLLTAPSAAAPPRDQAPVTLQQVQPSSLRVDRPVELSGVVRNTSDEPWGAVQVSMVVSESPVSTADGLAEARSDRSSLALRSVLDPGDFQDLGDLPPGAESTFTLRNAWDDLPITRASGAYVIGVEVRAFVEDGLRNTVASQTAFIPLVGPQSGARPVQMAMLWPLTAGVPRAQNGYADGSLAAQFAEEGRLSRLTDLGASAGDFPLSWVVDPAVLDAASDMADGYEVSGGEDVPEDDERATGAERWLSDTREALSGSDVLTLPYGDPDVASLAHGGLERALTPAAAAATSTLTDLDVPEQSLLWPANGWIDRRTLDAASRISPTTALIAADSVRGGPSGAPGAPAVVALRSGRSEAPAVVYDRSAMAPRARETTLQWRQHLLAVSAVRALHGGGPLVVVPPRTLAPSADAADTNFFAGLSAAWLRAAPLSEITGDTTGDTGRDRPRLRYPRRARDAELTPDHLTAIAALVRTTRTLVGVLADPATSQQQLAEATGIAASVHWREEPDFGQVLTNSYVDSNRTQLERVVIEAPSFITLSGREGQFPVTVSNGLSQPITVSVAVRSSNDALEIEPLNQVTIEPEQRRSIPVQARYSGVGISSVTVRMLDRNGSLFGDPVTLNVRTTQIGTVIWVVMALGGLIIFGAAGRSVIRRVRGRGTGEETSG